jgi:hypothetical protein
MNSEGEIEVTRAFSSSSETKEGNISERVPNFLFLFSIAASNSKRWGWGWDYALFQQPRSTPSTTLINSS